MSKFLTSRNGKDRDTNIAVNTALAGRTENTKDITLAIDVATTNISDPRIGQKSKFFFTATSLNAAVALRNMYVSEVAKGVVTITHPITNQTDRNFHMMIVG